MHGLGGKPICTRPTDVAIENQVVCLNRMAVVLETKECRWEHSSYTSAMCMWLTRQLGVDRCGRTQLFANDARMTNGACDSQRIMCKERKR